MHTQIKSFEDACKALSIEPVLPEVSGLPEKHQKAIIANYKLFVIAQALNGGWVPNWNDFSERKYYPWFDMETPKGQPPGSGFSFFVCGGGRTHSTVGSRLYFKSEDIARYAGNEFLELYKDLFLF